MDKDKETIVGFQTDKPLKRSLQPFGGIRMAEEACKAYGYEVDPEISYIFKHYRKTHNEGVFDVYTPEMRSASTMQSSPVCRMLTVVAVSSVTIVELHCMVLTS